MFASIVAWFRDGEIAHLRQLLVQRNAEIERLEIALAAEELKNELLQDLNECQRNWVRANTALAVQNARSLGAPDDGKKA